MYTTNQLADILHKDLSFHSFLFIHNKIGFHDLFSNHDKVNPMLKLI